MTRIILRDGRVATMVVATQSEDDVARIRSLYERVSRDSLYARFMHVVKHVSDAMIRGMIADGGAQGITLLCIAREETLAMGHYMRGEDAMAEVAFLVDDQLRNMGLGTLLLEHLAEHAWRHGITRFEAHVLRENTAMQHVFRQSGYAVKSDATFTTIRYELPLALTEQSRHLRESREKAATARSLAPFFRPRAIALIGASRNPVRLGHLLLRHILLSAYQGAVFPVNPTAYAISGVRAYQDVAEIPDPIDLAVIVVPAKQASTVVASCVQAGIRAIMVASSGFAEADAQGAARQEEMVALVRGAGGRLLGPNGMGVVNTDCDVSLNASFSPVMPKRGALAIASHSGALGVAILEYATRIGVGIASFVSLGNRADVSGNDLLQYWEDDPETEMVALYLESFGNPRKFSRIVRRMAPNKPILVVKSARTAAGVALSDTRQTTQIASDLLVDALFRQTGIIRVDTLQDIFDVAALLSTKRMPRGRRVAIVTNTAGGAVIAADTLTREGLQFVGPLVNLGFEELANSYRDVLPHVLRDPAVDAVIVIFTPVGVVDEGAVLRAIGEAVNEVYADSAQDEQKPVVANLLMMGEEKPRAIAVGGVAIPIYPFPEQAVRALSKVAEYAFRKAESRGSIPEFEGWDHAAIRAEMIACKSRADRLCGESARTLMNLCGVDLDDQGQTPNAMRSVAAEGGRSDENVFSLRVVSDPLFGLLLTLNDGEDGSPSDVLPRDPDALRITPLTDVDARELALHALKLRALQSAALAPAGVDEFPPPARSLSELLLRISTLVDESPEISALTLGCITVRGDHVFVQAKRISFLFHPDARSGGETS
ncbi:bifunctional acetate--CoA ligase family protein/GNAT family N-acetyltransferase [Ferroacidibacillus organovorans]|uniref:N-acetyltransferase domain-containing protein n=1 Tax=Ferroacidibacillus organovorans TaxID=1765683 RepID=A0A853K9I0_9BACL|nr:GNAT family N-acetyltransferase [Ferroacidibacillus organovorans]KYP81057.1 hypothetical protein AYJ22_08995 [Ferroacidibacillus organovorans]OAG93685.1 hypothetical protein AYW79_09255 [Ferroacidibacillus organovorans]